MPTSWRGWTPEGDRGAGQKLRWPVRPGRSQGAGPAQTKPSNLLRHGEQLMKIKLMLLAVTLVSLSGGTAFDLASFLKIG